MDDRPPTRMERLPNRLRGLGLLWVQIAGAAVAVSALLGPVMPLMVIAFLLTLAMPILGLYLWGRALDEQLGWIQDEDQNGSW